MIKEEKYLIIGGNGFIGSNIARQLSKDGNKVKVFGRNANKFYENIGFDENIEWYCGDLYNQQDVDISLIGVTDIIYLASASVPSSSMSDMTFDIKANTLPMISFLETLKNYKNVKRFLFVSSGGTIYGNSLENKPLREFDPKEPISVYGLNKLIAEYYIKLFASQMHVKFYILRPGNVYGKKQNMDKNQGVVGIFLKSLLEKTPVTVFGEGMVVRDFVYVSDLARSIIMCLKQEPDIGETVPIFNIGSGVGVSIKELTNRIQDVTGQRLIIISKPFRDFDCKYNVLDTTKIKNILGWEPKVGLNEGIEITWEWILSNQKNK